MSVQCPLFISADQNFRIENSIILRHLDQTQLTDKLEPRVINDG